MKIKIRKSVFWLYVVVFAAVFNDILRFGDSEITVFRLLLIIGIFKCFQKNFKTTFKVYSIFAGIMLLNFFQTILFSIISGTGISFSPITFFSYVFFYFCIVSVILMVYTIYIIDPVSFMTSFEKFIVFLSVCIAVLMLLLFLRNMGYVAIFNLQYNNINNYGAYLAGAYVIFLYKALKKHKFFSIFMCTFIICLLYLADCKLDLLGVIVETMVMIPTLTMKKHKHFRKILLIGVLLMLIAIVMYMANRNMSIFNHSINDLIVIPIKRIISGVAYDYSNSSGLFRVNIFIYGMQWICKSFLLGIGMGNSGKLMRKIIPGDRLEDGWAAFNSMSIHNTFIELLLEFGFVLLILIVWLVINYRKNRININKDLIFKTTIIGSVFWLLAPSTILNDYFIFILFTYLYLSGFVNFDSH